jgi:hypothetical protein
MPFSVQVLFNQAPSYERASQAWKDARRLGLHYESGEATIWRDISVTWELGIKKGLKELGVDY